MHVGHATVTRKDSSDSRCVHALSVGNVVCRRVFDAGERFWRCTHNDWFPEPRRAVPIVIPMCRRRTRFDASAFERLLVVLGRVQ